MITGWPSLWDSTDNATYFILAICVLLLIGVMGTMLFFVFRYSRAKNPNPENIENNVLLEIIWTAIPTLLVLAIFWVGWKGFIYLRTVPPGAMQVKVTGRMWSWSFEYENGKQSAVLKLPLGKPVKLLITSKDVLHSVFIPAFRVKEDAVPGKETYLWFKPDHLGSYDLFCTELCGAGHADMMTKVEVVPGDQFSSWYVAPDEIGKGLTPATLGERVVREKGCGACHSTDGTGKMGPTLKGLWGKKVIVLRNGTEAPIVVDAAHIKRKLFEPEKERVSGYPPVMPSQKGLVNDREADGIVEYLKTLR